MAHTNPFLAQLLYGAGFACVVATWAAGAWHWRRAGLEGMAAR